MGKKTRRLKARRNQWRSRIHLKNTRYLGRSLNSVTDNKGYLLIIKKFDIWWDDPLDELIKEWYRPKSWKHQSKRKRQWKSK